MNRPSLSTVPQLATEVRGIVAHVLGVPTERIRMDDPLDGALGIDSMRMIRISVALEARFGVVLADDVPLRTVGDLVASISSARSASEPEQ